MQILQFSLAQFLLHL